MRYKEAMSRVVDSYLSRRWAVIVSLCVITPAGFACKYYAGPGRLWFNHYGGGMAYEIFWCLVVFFFWPEKKAAAKIAVWVFIGSFIGWLWMRALGRNHDTLKGKKLARVEL